MKISVKKNKKLLKNAYIDNRPIKSNFKTNIYINFI